MEEGQLIPIVSIVGGFSLGGLFWWLVIRAQVRAREMLHAERLAAIAKGLPPPDEPAAESGSGAPNGSGALPQAPPKAEKALGTGLFWLFLGAGVILALRIVNPSSTSWGWGVIPVSLGLAYLAGVGLSWQLARPAKDDRPRQDDGHR